MRVTDAVNGLFRGNIFFWLKIILVIILAVIVVGTIVWQTNVYFSKSYQKGENYITVQAKAESQVTGKDPCDILNEWLAKAKSIGDKQTTRDIQLAQKFLGCRNKQKRQNR